MQFMRTSPRGFAYLKRFLASTEVCGRRDTCNIYSNSNSNSNLEGKRGGERDPQVRHVQKRARQQQVALFHRQRNPRGHLSESGNLRGDSREHAEASQPVLGGPHGIFGGVLEERQLVEACESGGETVTTGQESEEEKTVVDGSSQQLGHGVLGHLGVVLLAVEAVADAGTGAAGTTGTLTGGGAGDEGLMELLVGAVEGGEEELLGLAGVEDVADVGDGEGGLGEVGAEDAFAYALRERGRERLREAWG